MPNNVTRKFSYYNIDQFIQTLGDEDPNRLYLFVARAAPWTDETDPPSLTDLEREEYRVWENIIAIKRITQNDVNYVVPRIDWRPENVYQYFDSNDPDIYSKRFYVLNSNYEVYICLVNNRGAGSTTQPTGKSFYSFQTADGYKWKYLYSIPASQQLKFLTRRWMPVLIDSDVRSLAVDGKIEVVRIINQGSGYTYPNILVQINGNGSGLSIAPVIISNRVTDFNVYDGGSGYRYANINISSSTATGNGAIAEIMTPPKGGHGFDPRSELGAKYMMVNAKIEYAEGSSDFPTDVTYRTVGLLRDPIRFDNRALVGLTANANYTLDIDATFSNEPNVFSVGTYITGADSGANGYIVSANVQPNMANVLLRYIQTPEITGNFRTFNRDEIVYSSNSGSGIVRLIANPEVKPFVGEILYIDNRPPVTRAPDQAENIHIVLEF